MCSMSVAKGYYNQYNNTCRIFVLGGELSPIYTYIYIGHISLYIFNVIHNNRKNNVKILKLSTVKNNERAFCERERERERTAERFTWIKMYAYYSNASDHERMNNEFLKMHYSTSKQMVVVAAVKY